MTVKTTDRRGQQKKKNSPTPELSLDKLTPQEKEAVDKLAEEKPPEDEETEPNLDTGFYVAHFGNGQIGVINGNHPEGLRPSHEAGHGEIVMLLGAALESMRIQTTAMAVLQAQGQQAAMMKQQMEAQQIQHQVQSKGGYKAPGGGLRA